MSYIELRPRIIRGTGVYTGDKIRVSFNNHRGKLYATVYIGKDAARKYGFNKGDRVILLIDEFDHFKWTVIHDGAGFKLDQVGNNLKLYIPWRLTQPKTYASRFMHIELLNGQLQLSLPNETKSNE